MWDRRHAHLLRLKLEKRVREEPLSFKLNIIIPFRDLMSELSLSVYFVNVVCVFVVVSVVAFIIIVIVAA